MRRHSRGGAYVHRHRDTASDHPDRPARAVRLLGRRRGIVVAQRARGGALTPPRDSLHTRSDSLSEITVRPERWRALGAASRRAPRAQDPPAAEAPRTGATSRAPPPPPLCPEAARRSRPPAAPRGGRRALPPTPRQLRRRRGPGTTLRAPRGRAGSPRARLLVAIDHVHDDHDAVEVRMGDEPVVRALARLLGRAGIARRWSAVRERGTCSAGSSGAATRERASISISSALTGTSRQPTSRRFAGGAGRVLATGRRPSREPRTTPLAGGSAVDSAAENVNSGTSAVPRAWSAGSYERRMQCGSEL
jgi:hypothetical protein